MNPRGPESKRLEPFGTSIFTEMNRLALAGDAINLAQGFPDFPGPEAVKEAACRAIREDHNQYAPSHGVGRLRRAIAERVSRAHSLRYDEETEITVTSGATEAIHSTLLALVEPGDEVITFEPYYDSYPPCVAMAGGTLRTVPLASPRFEFDPETLERMASPRTRIILVNTPHNPTGRVFSLAEMETIARIARKHDAYVVTDEVYEELVFDDAVHIPMATLEGMRDRTITISSTAKTFSLTGWKIGYALAAPPLTAAIRKAHQFITYATATPLQHAMAHAIETGDGYYPSLRTEYTARRDLLVQVLQGAGFRVEPPGGTYFIMADFTPIDAVSDDISFCKRLITENGVAAIPPSAFYQDRQAGAGLIRFCFCKELDTIRTAGMRLSTLSR